jgi:integrase
LAATGARAKTTNAVRVVDIPEILAIELRDYVVDVNGYLLSTEQGKPLQQRNVLRVLHSVKRVGFHAFRRFRLTWLRKNGVPKDLERYWMGHAPEEVGDLYSKLKDDVAFRQLWAEREASTCLCGRMQLLNSVPVRHVDPKSDC